MPPGASLPSEVENLQSSLESAIADLKAAKALMETHIASFELWMEQLADMHEVLVEITS